MPKGNHFSRATKELIFYHRASRGASAEEIFRDVFMNDSNRGSVKRIRDITTDIDALLREENEDAQQLSSSAPVKRGGRDQIISSFERDYIIGMMRNRHFSRVSTMLREFTEEYYALPQDALKYSTAAQIIADDNLY